MSDLIFPSDLAGYQWDSKKKPVFSTLLHSPMTGRDVRIALYRQPVYEFILHNGWMNTADKNSLMAFFVARKGVLDSFLYADEDCDVSNQVIGAGNGVIATFQLIKNTGTAVEWVCNPAPNAQIYVDGALKTVTTDYTINWKGEVVFVVAPAVGAVISWSGVAYYRCVFLADELEVSQFANLLYECGEIAFKGSFGWLGKEVIVVIPTIIPWYTIETAALVYSEGDRIAVLINAYTPPALFYWTVFDITTNGLADLSEINGLADFSLVNGLGNMSTLITATTDNTVEPPKTFKLQLREGSITGAILAESAVVTINDTTTIPVGVQWYWVFKLTGNTLPISDVISIHSNYTPNLWFFNTYRANGAVIDQNSPIYDPSEVIETIFYRYPIDSIFDPHDYNNMYFRCNLQNIYSDAVIGVLDFIITTNALYFHDVMNGATLHSYGSQYYGYDGRAWYR